MGKYDIDYAPFSLKHKLYIHRALDAKMSVAEGSIRSGKTIDNCIIAAAYLEECPDKLHLASGSTIGNAKLNIGSCNGFGLENLFGGRCKWGKYKDNECLYIYTKTGEKIVIFAGGGKSDSYKRILGNSYGLWIATEINEHYDSEDSRESFIKVAFGRQAAAVRPKVLWDLNPCNPHSSIYGQYIDLYKRTYLGGYNYEHFTLADNLSISDERREEIASQYDRQSIWYKRDILGERCVSEGLVYRAFADNPDMFLPDVEDVPVLINIGVDFGGNGSATAFVCTGFTAGLRKIIILKSERHPEELDPERLCALFAAFVGECVDEYGKEVRVYADSAETVLIRGLRRTVIGKRLKAEIFNARKMPVLQRIKLVNQLMAQGRFFVSSEARSMRDAISEQVWDAKHEDTRLDNGTTDVDSMDAMEYTLEGYFSQLMR